MEPVYLSGRIDTPSSWKICYDEPKEMLGKFNNYEECRKWAIKEMANIRKQIGRNMNQWIQRNNLNS